MTYHVLNLGAGVQSTWVYLAYMRGEISPQIDVAVFADTGEEPAAVYEHLAWLRSLNGPNILVRTVGSKLGDNLLWGQNSTGQWRHLRDTDASGWARAVEIDDALRIPGNVVNRGLNQKQKLYVHFDCIPLRSADLDDVDGRQLLLDLSWDNECVGMCGV